MSETPSYDIAIIGTGPAGISAAINAKIRNKKFILFGSDKLSAKVECSHLISNYPALPEISGKELNEKLASHLKQMDIAITNERITGAYNLGSYFMLLANQKEYKADAVILATGAQTVKEINGERELLGKGVSYCATCDGAFFRERVTAVIGGGDSAVEDVIFLSRICKKVYMIHRRDSLKASKSLQSVLDKLENVEILWDTVAEAIKGNSEVETLQIKNQKTQEKRELSVDGVFVAVGAVPNTKEFQNLIQLDEAGYIAAEEDCRTNVAGIYAAGDIRTKALRQVVTAVSDGANAVYSAQKYLSELA